MTDFNKMYDTDRVENNHDNDELDVPSFLKKEHRDNIMSKKNYEELVRNSTSGLPVKAKPNKMKKVNKNRVKKALVTLCCTCMIIGAIAAQGVKSLVKGVNDSFEIENAIHDFKIEAVVDNTFRVNHGKDYDYHYDKIAEHIKTDEDVYLCYRSMGQYTDRVLQHVEGVESIDNFLETRNYDSKEEWVKVSNQQILLKNDISSKQQELNKMTEEYKAPATVATTAELGGK